MHYKCYECGHVWRVYDYIELKEENKDFFTCKQCGTVLSDQQLRRVRSSTKKKLDWKFKLILVLVSCVIVGLIGGNVAMFIIRQMGGEPGAIVFWIGFGIGFIIPGAIYLEAL